MRNLLFIFLSTCVFTTFGQYYSYPFKVHIGGGGASYFGDLCEDINCSSWNYNVSLNTRSVFSEHFSVYTHLNFSRLGCDDKENTVRNLSFRSDNIGFGVGTYYSFTKYYVHEIE